MTFFMGLIQIEVRPSILCAWLIKWVIKRSSWLNCALRDDEAVYMVSIGHYEAVAVGNWWYWVSRGHLCLYILHKVEIWSGVTDALLTTLKVRATRLLLKHESGALVTQNLRFFPGPPNWCRLLPQDCLLKGKCALFGCTAIFLQKSPQILDFRWRTLRRRWWNWSCPTCLFR